MDACCLASFCLSHCCNNSSANANVSCKDFCALCRCLPPDTVFAFDRVQVVTKQFDIAVSIARSVSHSLILVILFGAKYCFRSQNVRDKLAFVAGLGLLTQFAHPMGRLFPFRNISLPASVNRIPLEGILRLGCIQRLKAALRAASMSALPVTLGSCPPKAVWVDMPLPSPNALPNALSGDSKLPQSSPRALPPKSSPRALQARAGKRCSGKAASDEKEEGVVY